jgi:hypothetical protein
MDPETAARIAGLEAKIDRLTAEVQRLRQGGFIIEKAFRVIGLHANLAEFGAFQGYSLIQAYHAARRVYEELAGGDFDHSFAEPEAAKGSVRAHWEGMRFFAFDSFAGIPEPPEREVFRSGTETTEIFPPGAYACSEEDFHANLRRHGFPMEKLVTIRGPFEETCDARHVASFDFRRIGIVHIDADLYHSAKLALDFVTPYPPR